MFHRLWTLIRKELQSLLREPQTRAILIMPVLIQVLLFPFAATLEVTNATIAIYNEDNGRHAVELTQRFARAKAFTHVMLLKSPQEIRPTIDEQKALLLIRFPADFSRNLDTNQPAPLQLLLDGRNSNSAQIAANYLQQIVKNYQQELLEGKAKPNNSELIVRNWYNPNLDYKWFVVPSLIAMITHHRGDDRHVSLGGPRAGARHARSATGFAAGHLANFRWQSGPGADCRHAAGEHRAGYRHLGVSNPLRRFAAAVLLYDGHLRFVAGGIRSADFVFVLNPAAGFHRRFRLYDAGDPALRLRLAG
ncbi:Inner membrane transport permease ybhR [Raoultella planticola]|uniref:Inner membrane transport permease ybhR n=1 Tax=Raoultella planticola TaxID=575 RepID=A0A485AUY3_RAOPL|nr:Inner membrane transport permease ybhR [Raoultella planticola]